MQKYEVQVKKFSELRGMIEIPKFQRGLVWSDPKKHEFIHALKSGLPIGVLLLSKKGDKYLIVDGLQRYTTMLDYRKNVFKYIDKSEISEMDIMSVIVSSPYARSIFEDYTESAKRSEKEKIREIIATSISGGYGKSSLVISTEAMNTLITEIAMFAKGDQFSIQNSVFDIVERFFSESKIDDISVPVIIFLGDDSELATIFQKLNQEGVRLSKYDVFAASWINHYVTVKNDPAFIDYIIKKYDKAKNDSGLEIESYDPDEMRQTGELTVFEYAYALGKALMDRCQKLFPKANDEKVDSIGFLILAELMGLTYQKMGNLAGCITSYKTLDFKRLKDAIVECCAFVENALGSYILSPTHGKSGKRASLACHSELQLASYIIIVFKLKYCISKEDGLIAKNPSRELKRIREYLPRHYLFDILRGFWSGSGDSKLEDVIHDPETCRYTKDVAQTDFEAAVSSWLESGIRKIEMKNVSTETKLFLNYLLRERVPAADKISYDVEHCVPKEVVNKLYIKKGHIVPLSSPCNLAYIPSTENRAKGDLTYYQRQKDHPGSYTLDHITLSQLCYPTETELRFVDSVSTLTEENYYAFLSERKKYILHSFITALYPQ